MCSELNHTALKGSAGVPPPQRASCARAPQPCPGAVPTESSVAHQGTNGFLAGTEGKWRRALSMAAEGESTGQGGERDRPQAGRARPAAQHRPRHPALCVPRGALAGPAGRPGGVACPAAPLPRVPPGREGGRLRTRRKATAQAAPASTPLATAAPAAPNQRAAMRAQPMERRAGGRGAPERGGPATRRAAILTSEEQKRWGRRRRRPSTR